MSLINSKQSWGEKLKDWFNYQQVKHIEETKPAQKRQEKQITFKLLRQKEYSPMRIKIK